MKSPAKCAAWLLPLLLSGCASVPFLHKEKPTPTPALAPPVEPSRPLELAVVEIPPAQSLIAAKPIYNMNVEPVPIKQPVRHHRPLNKPVEVPEEAANPIPAVSALGQLSSGDPVSFRNQTEDSIAAIERGLNGINRPLDDTEQKTAGQIREFIKQAKTALSTGDTDGAHTLAEKAKALLDELTK
ncbi:MAG: hypothetical protein WBA18_14710 [Terracidiphilus sp.]